MSDNLNAQPKVQTAAQRLEYKYLLHKRKKVNKKSRVELFTYWLESVSVEEIAKSTSLEDISTTARRLLIDPCGELNDGNKLLLQWTKTPQVCSRLNKKGTMSNGNIQLLRESAKEVEIWLFSIAIYVLWKRESKYDEALQLCSRVIGIASMFVNHIATLSPRSHMEREDNEDKKSTLNILKSTLQKYETSISQECVNSYVDRNDKQKPLFSIGHKQRLESLKKRMEFNSQRLKSLNTKGDSNMMIFRIGNRETDKEVVNEDKGTSTYFLPPSDRVSTFSDILYPHLVYHPYFNAP